MFWQTIFSLNPTICYYLHPFLSVRDTLADSQLYNEYKFLNMLKISIVTVSFNQGQFIRQNIESVLSQNYPNCEHIIIDGGSTDETVSILK